ncbi:LOW QUALITY PROTEIN: serine-rich adhesin for platelets-like [Argopecten irradians]|uniref:LOW QUALITY PROTEIN: serine-rich adhesin for platelets-like n=1 Tax=Argopecten irradians TaxID=31199 RepID=UPI00371B053F
MGKPKKKKEFFVNPLRNKNVGWRTGKDILAGKNIRVNEQGFENLEDYYSESDADLTQDLSVNISRVTRNKSIAEKSNIENVSLPESTRYDSSVQSGLLGSSQSTSNMFGYLKNKNIGRRTGKDILAGKVITKNSHGFENIEDYFSESSDAESMFMSKSRISSGLDHTDVEKSDPYTSVTSTTTDDETPNAGLTDDINSSDAMTPTASQVSPIPEGSEEDEGEATPTGNTGTVEKLTAAKATGNKTSEETVDSDKTSDITAASVKTSESTVAPDKATDITAASYDTSETTVAPDKVSEAAVAQKKPSEATLSPDKKSEARVAPSKTSEVTVAPSQTSEDTVAQRKTPKVAIALDKTSVVTIAPDVTTEITDKTSKSFASNTINIGGNVTGSLTKPDDSGQDSTGPIQSFRTRKKLSFSALEKSLVMMENQNKIGSKTLPVVTSNQLNMSANSSVAEDVRNTSKVVVNNNPFNKSRVKSTSNSIVEDVEDNSQVVVNSNPFIKSSVKSTSNSVVEDVEDVSKSSVPESVDQESDISMEDEYRIVSDSEIKTTKQQSKSTLKGRTRSLSKGHKSNEMSVIRENVIGDEGSESQDVQTTKSVGKRKSQANLAVPSKSVEESSEIDNQNTDKTLKRKSLKRKSDDDVSASENVKSVGKQKSQKKSVTSKTEDMADGPQIPSRTSKRKSNALVQIKASNKSRTIDEHKEGNENEKSKKTRSKSTKEKVTTEQREMRKIEYLFESDDDDSSAIIEEFENEMLKKLKIRRSHKLNTTSGKRSKSEGDDQGPEVKKEQQKKRRTFVLGDYDSDSSIMSEKGEVDNVKKRKSGVTDRRISSTSKVNDRKSHSFSTSTSRKSHLVSTPPDDKSVLIISPTRPQGSDVGIPGKDISVDNLPGDNLPGDDLPGEKENLPDDSDDEKQDENIPETRSRRRAVSRKKQPEKERKGKGSLKQTLSKGKTSRGVGGKTNVAKAGKTVPKKVSKAKGKILKEQVAVNETKEVAKIFRGKKQKISIGFVENSPVVSTENSPYSANSLVERNSFININQSHNSQLDEEQQLTDQDGGVTAEQSFDNKSNRRKSVRGKKDLTNNQSVKDNEESKRKSVRGSKKSNTEQEDSKQKTVRGSKKSNTEQSVTDNEKEDSKQKTVRGSKKSNTEQSVTDNEKEDSKQKTVRGSKKSNTEQSVTENEKEDSKRKSVRGKKVLTDDQSIKDNEKGVDNKPKSVRGRKNSIEEQSITDNEKEIANKRKSVKGRKRSIKEQSITDNVNEKEVDKRKSVIVGKKSIAEQSVTDNEKEDSDSDVPMLSLSKKSMDGRSQLIHTYQSPVGSCTPFSATPGSEFTMGRREEMFRSGVSFRQKKIERSAEKSKSRNNSRTSDIEDAMDDNQDDEEGNDAEIEEAVPDMPNEIDNDDFGGDLPQDVTGYVDKDEHESSIDKDVNATPKGRKSTKKSKVLLGLGSTPKSSSESQLNLTPCLVAPGRKSLSKGRRVTISHQVTEAVYHVPSDLSSSDSAKSSPRASISGGDMTTYISMSSTPIHVCERTTTESPKPFQMPEKSKIILPDPSPPEGLRRSRRTRVRTLEGHKNERVNYQYRKSGGFVIAGIIPSQEAKILEKERQKREARKKVNKRMKKRRKGQSPPRNLSMHTELPSDMSLTEFDELLVINPDTGEEVFVELFASKDNDTFVGPSGKAPTPEDPFVMSRTLDQKSFGIGVLLLRPLQEKTIQMVSRGTLIFQLQRGVVALTVHKTSMVMEAGDSAFVPRGNTYSMKNLRSEEAKLSYTVLKEANDYDTTT